MKKRLFKKTIWQTIFSVVVLAVFIFFAIGSINDTKIEYLGDGIYKEKDYYVGEDGYVITKGKKNQYGKWTGPIVINTKETYSGTGSFYTEKVNFVNGLRHGKSVTKYYGMTDRIACYKMGVRISCENKSAQNNLDESSANEILNNKYPWFIYSLNAFGFDDNYVEAYMEALELLIGKNEFSTNDFYDFYDNAIDSLETTIYDSIIVLNNSLTINQGTDLLKDSEFRMAVIDQSRSDDSITFDIVKTKYSNYLLSINQAGATNADFKGFCSVFDEEMDSYGVLDKQDPFFLDSIDVRIYRALSNISDTEKSALITGFSLKTVVSYLKNKGSVSKREIIDHFIKTYLSNSTPKEVVNIVTSFMFKRFGEGDLIRRAVREAYYIKGNIVRLPSVTTEFLKNSSTTSVKLNGTVIEDGGAIVTERGIVWAKIYNPTTDNEKIIVGTGIGDFTTTLHGLTEGDEYYARAFATNSEGTVYGNCISFIAKSATGIDVNKNFSMDFNIYPNPASAITTLSFNSESTENLFLTIVDLNGKIVYNKDLGNSLNGKNRVQLNLSGLTNGIYNCQLTNNSTIKVNRKLLIAH